MANQRKSLPGGPPYARTPLRLFPGIPLSPRQQVSQGSKVNSERSGPLRLGVEIGSGGEGVVFETSAPGVLAKVFKDARLTAGRREKLRLMVAHGLPSSAPEAHGICWPSDCIADSSGTFRGYLMPRANGRSLGSVLFIRSEMQTALPHWNRRHLATLALSILSRIEILHRQGILLGDINPENILVKSERKVFFVDTDSYQLGGFPCPVGTVHFTPPELQGVSFSKTLRTREHEYFAVATLLFMILLLGKQPYACRGGGSPAENIRRRKFPYPLGKQSRGIAPSGDWRFIWSHLPFEMKKAFFETFDASCADKPRRTVSEWRCLLRKYEFVLHQGHVSDELFPGSLKPISEYARAEFGAKRSKAKVPSKPRAARPTQPRPVLRQLHTASPKRPSRPPAAPHAQSAAAGPSALLPLLKRLFTKDS